MAASSTVGNLQYVISVQTTELIDARRDIENLRREVNTLASSSSSVDRLETSFTALAGAVAGIVSAGGLVTFMKQISESVGQQKIFADSIGTSYEQLQRLQYVAGQFDVEADGLNDALKELSMQINEAASGDNDDLVNRLQEMGIAMSDIKNLSPDEQFIKLADGMSSLTDQSRKLLIANDLLGEESTKLVSILEQGSDVVRQYTQEADKLGSVISDDVAQDFVEFNRSLDNTTKALSGVATTAVAGYASEMTAVSSAVTSFIQDGEKVQNILDGIGVAAMATSTIIAGRLVGAFGAWAVSQATAIAATAAASAGLTTLSGVSALAATRLVAVTAATRGLSLAMSLLGGPVGVVAALASAIGLWIYSTKDAESAVASLNTEMKGFKTTLSGLSDSQLATALQKDVDALEESLMKVNSLEVSIKSLQKTFDETGSIQALAEANEQMKELEEARDNLARSSLKVKVEMEVDSKRSAKRAVTDIASTFDETKITMDVNELLEISGNLEVSGLDGVELINSDMEKSLKKLEDKYKSIPVFAMTYKEAEAQVLEKYNTKIAGLLESGADLSVVEKARDKEIASLTTLYDKKEQIIQSRLDIENSIRSEAASKIEAIESAALEKQKTAAQAIAQVMSNAQAEVASASEKINLSERQALDGLDQVLTEYPALQESIESARTAVKESYIKKREALNAQERAEEQSNQDKYLAILDSARRSIASTEELIVLDKEKELNNLMAIGEATNKTAEEIAEARLLIEAKYAQKEQELANAKSQAREQFFSIASSNSNLTAMEQIDAQEAAALESLKSNWDSSLVSEEEYYAERDKIREKYSEDREVQQGTQNDQFSGFASQFSKEDDSTEGQLEAVDTEEQAKLDLLTEYWELSNATYEEYEQAKLEIAQYYAEERQAILEEESEASMESLSTMLTSASDGFGSIADAISSAGEESSTAYQAMFAISKGFAIAQAGLNLTLAISNALASTPFPANIAAMASVASSGAALVSSISGTSYSGRQNGGDVSSGNTYKVNENKVPEIYSYGNEDYIMGSQNAKITPMSKYAGNSGSSGTNVTVNNNGTNTNVSTSQGLTENDMVILIKDTVPNEIGNVNSKTSKSMKNSTNTKRRLR